MTESKNKKASKSNQVNNLTLSALQKQNKDKYGEYYEVTIDGFNPIKMDKVWKPSKINSLVTEYLHAVKKELHSTNYNVAGAYLYLLMLRYFTSLPIPKELDKQLQWLEALDDSDYLSRLVANLPIDQIDKLNDELDGVLKSYAENDEFVRDQLSDIQLENEEVKKMVDDYISVDSE